VQQWNGNAIDSPVIVRQSPQLNRFPTQAQILKTSQYEEKTEPDSSFMALTSTRRRVGRDPA